MQKFVKYPEIDIAIPRLYNIAQVVQRCAVQYYRDTHLDSATPKEGQKKTAKVSLEKQANVNEKNIVGYSNYM